LEVPGICCRKPVGRNGIPPTICIECLGQTPAAPGSVLNENLITRLPPRQFQQVRKVLLPETLAFLEGELSREEKRCSANPR
jgi:hypothetical protein